ncbi:MAG TPA: ARMT1-like domain-containing protein [Candidatus Limnocylindrales bacterium]|nr:ARMT1-like domain-containing protein [Candidatus Limnocylindrales bacterium]
MSPQAPPPAPIRTDSSNPFAQHTMAVRVPAIVRDAARRNPDYPPVVLAALETLAASLEDNAPIQPPGRDWPDYGSWQAQWQAHAGEHWGAAEWFFAEIYLYRLLIDAVRWHETGRDPFAPDKADELTRPTLWDGLAEALRLESAPIEERLANLLTLSLWGNRIDLSLAAVAAHGMHVQDDDLLADDSAAAVDALLSEPPGAVHVICDNTGAELALDLALADALLDGPAETVTLHLKAHPTFVSDATLPDVESFLARLADNWYPPNHALADRLNGARLDGRLTLAPHPIWNSARFLRDFPPEALAWFEGAALVISKGDLNYRRLVGDAFWPADTPFAEVTRFFPAPLLALRTLKSDPIVGLARGQAEQLDAESPGWRTNGRRGVMQFGP